MPYNVTFLVNGTKPPRGGEMILARTVERLDRSRFVPRLIFATETPFVSRIRSACVESRRFKLDAEVAELYLRDRPWRTPLRTATVASRLLWSRTVPSVSAIAGSWKTNILFCGDNVSKLIAAMGARRSGTPTIGWCHDVLHRNLLGLTLQALNLGSLDRVIAGSRTVADSFPRRSVRSGKVVLIPYGIDTNDFTPAAEGATLQESPEFVVGIVGVLDENRGHRVLLHALADLQADGRDAIQLWVIGTGPEEAKLKRLAVELNIAHRVRFLGYLPEVREVLGRIQLLVMPTVHFESFGIAAVEAMAMGLPVVASQLGGLAEIVEDGRTGFLVKPGEAVELAGAIRRLMDSPDIRARMGQAGRRRAVEHFSLDLATAGLEGLLQDLVESKRS